jgi:hypothetical protein
MEGLDFVTNSRQIRVTQAFILESLTARQQFYFGGHSSNRYDWSTAFLREARG